MMRVPMIDTDEGRGPDLPDGFRGRARLTAEGDYELITDGPDPRIDAVAVASRLTVVDKVKADDLDDATLASLGPLFSPWASGLAVSPGEVYTWDGTLVEVIQGHTTQADWEPDAVPALFKVHRAAGTVSAWVQPTGGHDTYDAGAVVTHNGQTWDNAHGDGNSWEPGVFGWTAR